jgi:hypothetical protein
MADGNIYLDDPAKVVGCFSQSRRNSIVAPTLAVIVC